MTESSTQSPASKLATRLGEAAVAYYLGNPVMSDAEYDEQLAKLQKESGQEVHAIVAETTTKGFAHVAHSVPMLSLEKATNTEELERFDTQLPAGIMRSYVLQPKLDGMSLSCIYENGKLVRAVTRGNGREGDDVTAQAKELEGLPHSIPASAPILEIRGEVVVPWITFNALNTARAAQGEELYANPRNLAAGTMHSLDTSLVRARGLSFVPYDMIQKRDVLDWQAASELDLQAYLVASGFSPPMMSSFGDMTSLMQMLPHFEAQRRDSKMPWATDGVVIKLYYLKDQPKLGSSSTAPRWALAYKFPPVQKRTKLLGISVQIGRHGTLTPVAELEPVLLDGSTVARATLHNYDFVRKLNVRVGDTVVIQKAGDIIPQVVQVIETTTGAPETLPPEHCPFCGSPTDHDVEDRTAVACTKPSQCPGTLLRRIEHAVSKAALDIDGFGPVWVEKWVSIRGGSVSVSDLFTGHFEELCIRAGTPGALLPAKLGAKLLEQIKAARKLPPDRLLYALAIPHVGRTASRALMSAFGSIQVMRDCVETTTEVLGVGPATLASLRGWLQEPSNLQLLADLERGGCNMAIAEVVQDSQLLAGQTWVITGTLSRPREDFQTIIERNGGKATSSVSRKTTFLLAGDATGQKKLQDAKKHNVTVVTENDFWQKVNPQA